MKKIDKFSDKYEFLSNFYASPIKIAKHEYPTAEHAYQAAKAKPDSPQFDAICRASTPGKAKRLGQKVALTPNWEKDKLRVMAQIIHAKFYQNKGLQHKLIKTGNKELIEGNTWNDTFWGVYNGKGENHLGKILMGVREYYQKQQETFDASKLNRYIERIYNQLNEKDQKKLKPDFDKLTRYAIDMFF